MFEDLLITFTGRKSIYIENYKNLLDYQDDYLLIQGKKETVKINGTGFQIEYFTGDNMKIKGTVTKMSFWAEDKRNRQGV